MSRGDLCDATVGNLWLCAHLPSTKPSLITQLYDQKAMLKLVFISNIDKNKQTIMLKINLKMQEDNELKNWQRIT